MRGRGLRWPSLQGRLTQLPESDRLPARRLLEATLPEESVRGVQKPSKPRRQTRLGRGSAIPNVNKGEELFAFQISAIGLPKPERNWKFHDTRKWEIDFAWPYLWIGIEIQGGIYMKGGAHSLPTNIERDLRKHNALLDAGWRVWHWTPEDIKSGIAVQHMEPVIRSALTRLLSPKP